MKLPLLAIMVLSCFLSSFTGARGNANITISGRTAPLLQLSLNGSAYGDSAVDTVQLEPEQNSTKQSTLSVRTNVTKWSLNAQSTLETSSFGSGGNSAEKVVVTALPGQLQTSFISEPVNLASISHHPKTLLTATQPTPNEGLTVRLQYKVVSTIPNGAPISASVQYRLAAAP